MEQILKFAAQVSVDDRPCIKGFEQIKNEDKVRAVVRSIFAHHDPGQNSTDEDHLDDFPTEDVSASMAKIDVWVLSMLL